MDDELNNLVLLPYGQALQSTSIDEKIQELPLSPAVSGVRRSLALTSPCLFTFPFSYVQ